MLLYNEYILLHNVNCFSFWRKQISVHRPSFFSFTHPTPRASGQKNPQRFLISHSRSTTSNERIEVCEQAIKKWTCIFVLLFHTLVIL